MLRHRAISMAAALFLLVLGDSVMSQTIKPISIKDKNEVVTLVQGNHAYLSTYQNTGDGRMKTALDKIGADPTVLHIDINDLLGTTLTVPENIHLIHMGGAVIDLAGHDLQIEGTFIAGSSQVFTGTGNVGFASGVTAKMLPQWWGDNTSQNVQKALDAAVVCGAELFLTAGNYIFTAPVTHDFSGSAMDIRSLTIRGSGPGHTIIDNQTTGEAAFRIGTVTPSTDWAWFVTFGGLEITSTTGTGNQGLDVEDIWNGRIHDCFIHHLAGDGIFMRAGQVNDLGLCKTWTIERSVIFYNKGYGINLSGVDYQEVAYNIVMDQLDIEVNDKGGIFAAAESAKITHCNIAYNGKDQFSQGGIHLTGVLGQWVYGNTISGNGFEGNYPYDIFADRVSNTTIRNNGFYRVNQLGANKPDNFILLGTGAGAINAEIGLNEFSSGITGDPFTAVIGGPGLLSVAMDNNEFNIQASDTRHTFDVATKLTVRRYGDTTYSNQTLGFTGPGQVAADTILSRGSAGILKVKGGVANALQTVSSQFYSISIDCGEGLNVLHTLSENTTVKPPLNATTGAVLNLVIFQGTGAYTISFDPIFKLAEPFSASALHYSSIRFLFTGLDWIQLGGAAIDAPM